MPIMKTLIPDQQEVFLVKVPKYLGKQMRTVGNNKTIGEFLFDGQIAQIKFPTTIYPNKYEIIVKDDDNKYIANVGIDNNNECSIYKISSMLHVVPVMDAAYFEFKKKQKEQIHDNKHEIQFLNHFDELRKGEKYANLKEMEMYIKKKKQQTQEKKRERLEKPDVLNLIFKAFEKHDSWTVKDLADFSGQPIAYIQEIINEIAILDKKDNRNTYVLKDQFKYR